MGDKWVVDASKNGELWFRPSELPPGVSISRPDAQSSSNDSEQRLKVTIGVPGTHIPDRVHANVLKILADRPAESLDVMTYGPDTEEPAPASHSGPSSMEDSSTDSDTNSVADTSSVTNASSVTDDSSIPTPSVESVEAGQAKSAVRPSVRPDARDHGDGLESAARRLVAQMDYLARGAAGIVQVDVARIGGITPWLKVAHLAEAHNVPVCPHFLMELHVSLCAAVPNSRYLEYIPQLRAITRSELEIVDGQALAPSSVGLGIDWDLDAIDDLRVA